MANPSQSLLARIFRKLRLRESLSPSETRSLSNADCTAEQESSVLSALSSRTDLRNDELELFRHLAHKHPEVLQALGSRATQLLGESPPSTSVSAHWLELFALVRDRQTLNAQLLKPIIGDLLVGTEMDRLAAAWLMSICINGLSAESTASLTGAMVASGERFDYRGDPNLGNTRLVRRYPTGALSEKAALILPALIAAARNRVGVCSPFLVARSLGPTGGTWDKLSAVPEFAFPEPGAESIRLLTTCGVAMTVTKGSANPADRKLYQLRSVTGTIESTPLIVSSIASKQLSFPVHRLLLDIRVGEGAFLKDENNASDVGEQITNLLRSEGIACNYTLTTTLQPNGIAIGNALEVAEAIAVMGGHAGPWDERALIEQRLLVIDFFSKLLSAEFPSTSAAEWARYASEEFRNGVVIKNFFEILRAHGVSDVTIGGLQQDPWATLRIPAEPATIPSKVGGTLRRIDQFKIGEIVNRLLGGGANDFEGQFDPQSGILLAARIGDVIQPGAALCRIYTQRLLTAKTISEIESCFQLSQ